jgi:subtilisin-like proprotein convertase family protein
VWCVLLALSVSFTGCAQLLGTDDYKVDPSAFDNPDASVAAGEDASPGRPNPAADSMRDAMPPATPDMADADDAPVSDDGPTEPDDAPEPTRGLPDSGPVPMPIADPRVEGGTGGAGNVLLPEAGGGGTSGTDAGMGGVSSGANGNLPPEVEPPAVCGVPANGECDTVPQCGCVDGEACAVTDLTTGATQCIPAGDTDPYSECSGTDDCQVGYGCVGGLCKQLCDVAAMGTCPQGPYAECTQVTNGVGAVPGYGICLRTCDPVDPALSDESFWACGEGANCLPGENGVSFCFVSNESGAQGDSCQGAVSGIDPASCAPGYACLPDGDGASCMKSCEIDGDDCAVGSQCTAYPTPLGAANKAIGYCETCPGTAPGDCDILSQCGCSSGEMCAVLDFENGDTGCVPEGTTPVGESCDLLPGECEPGTECMQWIESGVCSTVCDTDADCPLGTPCVDWEVPGIRMCLHGCDPRDPTSTEAPFNACGANQSCTFWSEQPSSSVCVTPEVAAPEGATCFDEDTCAPGFTCVGDDGGGVCTAWCELGSTDCEGNGACVPHPWLSLFHDPLEVDGTSFGTCQPPTLTFENTTSEPIPDAVTADDVVIAEGELTSTISVTGATGAFSAVRVEVNITHTYVGDLDIYLEGPDGLFIYLVDSFGPDGASDPDFLLSDFAGDNFVATVFDDSAALSIYDGDAPFTGGFAPTEPLSTFLDSYSTGSDWNGAWTLSIYDQLDPDTGTLNSWKLMFY